MEIRSAGKNRMTFSQNKNIEMKSLGNLYQLADVLCHLCRHCHHFITFAHATRTSLVATDVKIIERHVRRGVVL